MILSEKVQHIIQSEGISLEELSLMVSHAATTSIRGFNRRYFHWILRVEDSMVVDMQYADLLVLGKKGDSLQREEHEPCNGAGCKGCNWIGEIGRYITDKPLTKHIPLVLPKHSPGIWPNGRIR